MQLDDRTEKIISSRKDPIALSIFLLEDNNTIIKCEKNIYEYNGKCYDLITSERLQEMFHKFCVDYGITSAWVKRFDVIQSVLSYEKINKVKKMNDYTELICLNNGILNIYTKEFIAHSPNYFFDSYIHVDYDPESSTCPTFINYLDNTFNHDQDVIKNIILLGGYLLDTENKAGKMFFFDGPAASGKSTLIDTFSMFFSSSIINPQITSISLADLATDKAKKIDLVTSRVNFSAEEKRGFLDAEEIKKIVTGDFINARGLYQNAVTFRPKTKLVVACNGLMTFTDHSDGIFRRIIIIRFKNQYKSERELSGIKFAEEKRIFVKDFDLFDKIKSEKSAILNLFLEGLCELRKRKYEFYFSNDSEEAWNEFRTDSDSIREFLEENYEINLEAESYLQDLYDEYKIWYRKNVMEYGSIKLRSNEFGKRVKDVFGLNCFKRRSLYDTNSGEWKKYSCYHISKKNEIIVA